MANAYIPGCVIVRDGQRWNSRIARALRAFVREWKRPVWRVKAAAASPTFTSACVTLSAGGGGATYNYPRDIG